MIVKIADDFTVDACMVDRKILRKGNGTYASLSWSTAVAVQQ